MTATPRTDEEFTRINETGCNCDVFGINTMLGHGEQCPLIYPERQMVDFARTLERELAEARMWVPVAERLPERLSNVLYWSHPPFADSGFPAIADEWKDEDHLKDTTHWKPIEPPETP